MRLRKLTSFLAGAVALSALAFATPSHAAQPAVDFVDALKQNLGSFTSIGFRFQTGANAITVDQLGVWDFGLNGLLTTHDVGIYTDGGTLLTSGTVGSGLTGSLVGQFRYVDIADIVLNPNTFYVISAQMGANGDFFAYGETAGVVDTLAGFTTNLGITVDPLNGGRFAFTPGDTLSFPNVNGNPFTAFLGPNFLGDEGVPPPPNNNVPEPGTIALLAASGFSGMGVAIRRRIRR